MTSSDQAPTQASSSISANDARRATRNIGVLIAASIISKGLLFGWQIVLGIWLGPFDYGIYNTVFALMAVGAPVANFGMGLILIREVARAPQDAERYWTAALVSQTMLTALTYIGLVAAAIPFGISDEAILAYTAIASLSLFIDLSGNIGYDLLIAQERMVVTSVVEISNIVLRIALAALALAAGWGLFGVYAATLTSGVIRTALLVGANLQRGIRPRWPLDRPVMWRLLVDSYPLMLSAFLALAYQHADKIMTTALIDPTSTGHLGPAFVINFGIIEVLSTTVLVAVYPLMSRAHAGGGEMFGFIVEKLARLLTLIVLPLALLLTLFADEVILAIYTPEYAPTGGILRILIWYTLLTIAGNVFNKAMLIQNRQRLLLIIRAGSLVVNVTLNAILLLHFRDPRGAAVASVVAESLALVLMAHVFRAEGYNRQRMIAQGLRLLLPAAAAAGVMVVLAGVHLLLAMAGSMVVYLLVIAFAPVLHDDDWDLIYRVAAAMPGGGLVRRFWRRDVAINW